MPDKPLVVLPDGRALYDNTPTVVCVLLHHLNGLVVVRRANDPGKGLLGLPGGYQMRGESWQECGAREVLEETGYRIDPMHMLVSAVITDTYQNNVLIARYTKTIFGQPEATTDGEVQEVLLLKDQPKEPAAWAFPVHFVAANYELRPMG